MARPSRLMVCAFSALAASAAFATTVPEFRAHPLGTIFSPHFAITDDFDLDGDPDVIVVTQFGPVRWYENDSTTTPPTFNLRTIASASEVDNPQTAYPVDFDGDGLKDIVVAQGDVGEVLLFKSTITNDVRTYEKSVLVTDFAGSQQMLPVDIDGDEDIDLLFNQFGFVDLGYYENLGGSPPQFQLHIIINGLYNRAVILNAADINQDGHMDFIGGSASTGARCNPNVNTASVYFNDGNFPPTFTPLRLFDSTCIVTPQLGDLDNDGDLDIVAVSEIVDVYKNTGPGPGTNFDRIPLFETSVTGDGVAFDGALADLNNDGALDILLDLEVPLPVNPNEDPRFAPVWLNNVVNFFPQFNPFLFPGQFLDPTQIEAADFDGDGDVDVFVLSDIDDMAVYYDNRLITCPGNCDGNNTIDFNDLICVLFQFGDDSPTGSIDCDGSGEIDFNDLICTLLLFGACDA